MPKRASGEEPGRHSFDEKRRQANAGRENVGGEEQGPGEEERHGSRLNRSSEHGLSLEKQQRRKCVNEKEGNYPPGKQSIILGGIHILQKLRTRKQGECPGREEDLGHGKCFGKMMMISKLELLCLLLTSTLPLIFFGGAGAETSLPPCPCHTPTLPQRVVNTHKFYVLNFHSPFISLNCGFYPQSTARLQKPPCCWRNGSSCAYLT